MMEEPENLMRRYLLGELPEPEQSALEERYFTDSQVFEQMLKTESELVDGYVHDRLPGEVRERFERFYMAHPERKERVMFAETLAAKLAQDEAEAAMMPVEQQVKRVSWWQKLLVSTSSRRPGLSWSIAVATLLIMIVGGVWLWVASRRGPGESAQTRTTSGFQQPSRGPEQQTEEERRRAEELAAEQRRTEPSPQQQIPQPTPTPALSPAQPRTVSLMLAIGGVRGGDQSRTPKLVITPEVTQARLRLNMPGNDYPSYDVSLQRVGGAEIFNQKGVKPGRAKAGASFVFAVPTGKLASGDYILTLKGVNLNGEVDELSKSLFRVQKR